MSEAVSVGVIGLGRIGWRHCQVADRLEGKFRLAAVSDTEESRLEEAAERFNCRTYDDYRGLIADESVELVVVATPTHLHHRHSVAALRRGKDTVCEKPLAPSHTEVKEILETAEDTGNLFTVFQSRRYAKDFLKVQEVINSGQLGRIVQIRIASHSFGRRWDWQTLKEFGGGTLNNNGIHFLDQALQFVSSEEPEVFCHLDKTPLSLGDAEDHVKIVLKSPTDPLVEVELTSTCAYPQDNWLVMGTLGTLRGTFSELSWKYIDPDGLVPRNVERGPAADRKYNREELPWQKEQVWRAEDDSRTAGHEGFYLDLYATLRKGTAQVISIESIERLMRVLDRCRRICPV